MKKVLTTLICTALSASVLLPLSAAAGTKKNDPDKKEVEKILKELGEAHYVERMKINDLCSLKFEDSSGEDDFYHIYTGTMKGGGYRIIIFNNKPEYLGYYQTEFEPSDYEEGTVKLDSGESDEDGNSYYYDVPIPDKGPADKIRIDGIPTAFVKGPGAEGKKAASGIGKAAAGATAGTVENTGPEYRDWKITMKGKQVTVNAVFEKMEKGKVFIKSSKNGKVAQVPGNSLSKEDQEYVKEILAEQKK